MISSKKIYFVNLLMAILPNTSFHRFKASLYRWAGVKVGKDVEFFQGIKVQGIGELEIGDHAFIGNEVLFMLNEGSRIIVGPSTMVSSRTILVTGFHPVTIDGERIMGREGTSSTITIGRGVGISVGCTILPGVTIGEMALVAASATVDKDLRAFTLVGGCPAKYIKYLK